MDKEPHWHTADPDKRYRPMQVLVDHTEPERIWYKLGGTQFDSKLVKYTLYSKWIQVAHALGLHTCVPSEFTPHEYYLIETFKVADAKRSYVWLENPIKVTKRQCVAMYKFRSWFAHLCKDDDERYGWLPEFVQRHVLLAPELYKETAETWYVLTCEHKPTLVTSGLFEITYNSRFTRSSKALDAYKTRQKQEALVDDLLGM